MAPRQPRAVALSARVYRACLRAYPPAFRRAYGRDMARVFRDACLDAYHRAGVWGVLLLWGPILRDLAARALPEGRCSYGTCEDAVDRRGSRAQTRGVRSRHDDVGPLPRRQLFDKTMMHPGPYVFAVACPVLDKGDIDVGEDVQVGAMRRCDRVYRGRRISQVALVPQRRGKRVGVADQ